jgi:hypothetical protein
MNTPGFTAHDSLYRSDQHYIAGLISSWGPPAAVAPGFKVPPGGEGDCHVTCGECSHNCMQTCQDTCRPEPYTQSCCDSSETCCSGKCVNTRSDSANCGACGHACTRGRICNHGVCGCPPGLTLCGNDCVDLSGNQDNCGACGVACPNGICCAGTCGTLCNDGTCCPRGQHCCGNGHCCPAGQPCCNTPLGAYCCSHKCNHTIFGNFCT